jgi:hypothetical protein
MSTLSRQAAIWRFYSGCQNNVPIGGRYFVTTTYAASFFSEYFYDMRYNCRINKFGLTENGVDDKMADF